MAGLASVPVLYDVGHDLVDLGHCLGLIVGEGFGDDLTGNGYKAELSDSQYVVNALSKAEVTMSWLPLAAEAPTIEDVPESIARAAREAHTSLSIGNYMSAILMARTVIEATAKANGITSGDLSKKINKMRDEDLIRPAIADRAHEVRYFGNDMAHGDIDEVPEQVDAEDVLALMGQVLSEVFQGPALMRRL